MKPFIQPVLREFLEHAYDNTPRAGLTNVEMRNEDLDLDDPTTHEEEENENTTII